MQSLININHFPDQCNSNSYTLIMNGKQYRDVTENTYVCFSCGHPVTKDRILCEERSIYPEEGINYWRNKYNYLVENNPNFELDFEIAYRHVDVSRECVVEVPFNCGHCGSRYLCRPLKYVSLNGTVMRSVDVFDGRCHDELIRFIIKSNIVIQVIPYELERYYNAISKMKQLGILSDYERYTTVLLDAAMG